MPAAGNVGAIGSFRNNAFEAPGAAFARWRLLMLEGATNLAAATAVLAWPALAIAAPFVRLVCAWAMVTGALLLAAAHRLSVPYGRWVLVLAGAASAGWGALATAADVSDFRVIQLWLVGYAVVFGGVLIALAGRLQRQQRLATQHP